MRIFKIARYVRQIPTLAIAVLFAWNLTFAEDSGTFVGVNIGYGDITMHTDTTAVEDSGDILTQYKGKLASGGGVNYGIVVGYKQFFTPYLGLRYYIWGYATMRVLARFTPLPIPLCLWSNTQGLAQSKESHY